MASNKAFEQCSGYGSADASWEDSQIESNRSPRHNHHPEMGESSSSEELEKKHFFKIIRAFKMYRRFSRSIIEKRITYLEKQPLKQQAAMKRYRDKLEKVLECVDENSKIIKLIIENVEKMFMNKEHSPPLARTEPLLVKVADVDKVQIVLKQLYRDWSDEGANERSQSYNSILKELEIRFPTVRERRDVSVLVPGAGLGRLAFEIAMRGFTCQGNEFSLFMLFAANFILNRCSGVNQYVMYPWTQCCDNNVSTTDMVTPIRFPDVDPSELHNITGGESGNRFTMIAGDFLEVYESFNEWDCIATCFFIDCANNIFHFIDRIYQLLKPGGLWLNLGPLQYHFSTSVDQESIEPSLDVVKDIIKSVGFRIEKESTVFTHYCQNPTSMFEQRYSSVFFVCIKPSTSCE